MTFAAPVAPIVVDASVVVELLAGSDRWTAQFERWADEDRLLIAPPLLLAEVANAQLRGRHLQATEAIRSVERLVAAGVETTDRGLAGVLEAVELAARYALTVYEALYLQLALDVDGELATLDADLRRAAANEAVPVVG